MLHAMVFHGTLKRNHNRLRSDTSSYRDTNDVERLLPETSAEGIHFGCMNDGSTILVVKAGAVVLDTPVPWDRHRHTDGKGIIGTQPSRFGHESAVRLLEDIIAANPGQRAALRPMFARVGRPMPASGPDERNPEAAHGRRGDGQASPDPASSEALGAWFGRPEQNAEVERAAVSLASARLSAEGWQVESVERGRVGYDLRCVRGNERQHVEVKGVSVADPAFIITESEVRCATSDPHFWLYVVTDARSSDPKLTRLSGAEFTRRATLRPIAYRATLTP